MFAVKRNLEKIIKCVVQGKLKEIKFYGTWKPRVYKDPHRKKKILAVGGCGWEVRKKSFLAVGVCGWELWVSGCVWVGIVGK